MSSVSRLSVFIELFSVIVSHTSYPSPNMESEKSSLKWLDELISSGNTKNVLVLKTIEEEEEVDVVAVSDDDYVESDLEYIKILRENRVEKETCIDLCSDDDDNEIIVQTETNIAPRIDDESTSSSDTNDASALKRYLDHLREKETSEEEETSDDTVKIEELIISEDDESMQYTEYDDDNDDDDSMQYSDEQNYLEIVPVESIIPETPETVESALDSSEEKKKIKCFICQKKCKKPRTRWMRCKDEGCKTYLCRLCGPRVNSIKINSLCINCGWQYPGGPTKELKRCEKCRFWKCSACVDPCRCVLRAQSSHHNFI